MGGVRVWLMVIFLGIVCHASSDSLTLDEAIREALAKNPDLASIAKRVDEAKALLVQARSTFLPAFTLSAKYTRLDEVSGTKLSPMPPLIPEATTLKIGKRDITESDIVLTQPIFTGGLLTSQYKAAKYNLEAERLVYKRAREQLVNSVREAFYTVLMLRRNQDIAKRHAELLEEHKEDVSAHIEAGTATRAELLLTEAKLQEAREKLLEAENAVKLAEHAFNRLLGREINADVALRDVEEKEKEFGNGEQLVEEALKEREDLKALQRQLEAARWDLRAAKAEYMPSVYLSAQYGWQEGTQREEEGDWRWLAAITCQLNIWDWGGREGRVSQKRARYEEILEKVRGMRQQIEVEVKDAYLKYLEAKKKLAVAKARLDAASEALRVRALQYKAGEATNLEYLEAEFAYIEAESGFVNAIYNLKITEANLEYACGFDY